MPRRSDIIRAKRRAVGGKRDRCKLGTSCGAACINRNKTCLINAPTPVANSIPRAIAAIQSRRERMRHGERRQALQRRREYVKSKIKEGAELEKQRKGFILRRSLVVRGINGAIISGDARRVSELQEKLKEMEREGAKLRVAALGKIDETEVRRKVREIEDELSDLKTRMARRAKEGAKGTYDKLEDRYLKAQDGLFKLTGQAGTLRKGQVWQDARTARRDIRNMRLMSVYDRLVSEAKQAARDNNMSKYREIEKSLLKVSDRIQKDGEIRGRREGLVKGVLWKDVKVPKVLEDIHKAMIGALDEGDLGKYQRLEEKFFNVKDKYLGIGNSYRRSNNLGTYNLSGGFRPESIVRGRGLSEYLEKLENDIYRAARGRDRREYNKLEERFMKLNPRVNPRIGEKGSIWREVVKERAQEFIAKTKNALIMAAENKNRREYNKLEKILMKLDPTVKKGAVWKRTLVAKYLPKLNKLLVEAAEEGVRRRYNKLERVLFRISPYTNADSDKGKIWRETRVGGAIERLMAKIERAVKDGDREEYDRLEDRFFRIKAKAPKAPAIRDTDLNYVLSRGQLWREIERSIPLQGLESSLDKGKREGVSNIKIRGGVDGYQVTSRVLGNDLKVFVTPNDSTSFTVNGSYTAAAVDLPRREQIAIIREVRRQYDEIFKTMDDGTVFMVTAAEGDGRKDMREKGYTGTGFSEPDRDGRMYGMIRGGRVTPIDEDEYDYVVNGGWGDED